MLKGNYERIFDAARLQVRAWEAINVGQPAPAPQWTPISGAGLIAQRKPVTRVGMSRILRDGFQKRGG